MQALMKHILDQIIKEGYFGIQVLENIQEELTKLSPELKLEALEEGNLPEQFRQQVVELFMNHPGSLLIRTLLSDAETLGLSKELLLSPYITLMSLIFENKEYSIFIHL